MNLFGIRLRLGLLSLAVAVMGVLIAWVTLNSQRHGAELRSQLTQVDAESYNIAEHFKDSMREVTDRLTHYLVTRSPSAWDEFVKTRRQLEYWIHSQSAMVQTERERDILSKMQVAYDDYARITTDLHDHPQTDRPALTDTPDPLAQSRRHLFDLGQDLSNAHSEIKKGLLTNADESLAELQETVLGALSLLLLSVLALAVLVYRDMIAPLRRRLVENQARYEQQEKLASLGLLAAGVAHEIRNPLTAIRAALFTQQRRFRPDSPEHADVKVVEREILRLERIVNDFLQFARPGDPAPEPIYADLLLQETRQFFSPQLARNNIAIQLDPSPVRQVHVDPAQIKQVLINLVQNAAESIGRDGTITLRARAERRQLASGTQSTVVLEVADTGKGMTPETQKRLFDPFYTTKQNGTGLGLSIALRIVEKHGGVIEYQTQPRRGSVFGVILPEYTS